MVRVPSQAIYKRLTYGPTFGGGHDFHISNNANLNSESRSYFGYGATYWLPSGAKDQYTILAGSRNFTPNEVEVFYLAWVLWDEGAMLLKSFKQPFGCFLVYTSISELCNVSLQNCAGFNFWRSVLILGICKTGPDLIRWESSKDQLQHLIIYHILSVHRQIRTLACTRVFSNQYGCFKVLVKNKRKNG